ncbi:gamma-glutamylcyclotransferase [Amycolatopsis sp. FDAARGOS 1241]|uniref:gamma-glutamylcyclotransferase n=1 Tax=Amycolatopsis sp. FDAARGOS 1241 TaxID=2778070 RepID=UPI0019521EF5|nr:gamma-glutamylcyclotransferase [Amycolatopsis sp. FDAARGOS 1241]QRP46822.1 gamma-glutamylcyclotransferase [Amycolatopsis sp. FDAARGOS 1241]
MHVDGAGHSLDTAPPGWRERLPVLAYGSNACPSKITWLRGALGLAGPVVAVRARCTGLAAVWASGLRKVDDQRPATLTALPGAEDHFVWFVTPEQRAVLDVCEGRGTRYHLARLDAAVHLEDGTAVPGVHAYVGASPIRYPLLVDGQAVRVADVAQAEAALLLGTPASTHGLRCTVVEPEQIFR